MPANLANFLDKYGDIIKEEINVKQISLLSKDIQINKIYKPIGSQISSKFGKDTGEIIKFAKDGNVQTLSDGQIKVIGNSGEWILDSQDYEIVYEGIDEHTMSVEEGTVVKLDLNITPQLKKEGIAREISRFLNQMRKDINYNVSDRVSMFFSTNEQYLKEVIQEYSDFLASEALLTEVKEQSNIQGDIQNVFSTQEGEISFTLKK